MSFSSIGRIFALLTCTLVLISIFLGVKLLLSIDAQFSEVHGLPTGPKIPLLNQGFLLLLAGLALGVLCDISDRVRANMNLSKQPSSGE